MMSQIDLAWGAGPTDRYETLANHFRPVFSRIAEGAVQHELARELAFEPIR